MKIKLSESNNYVSYYREYQSKILCLWAPFVKWSKAGNKVRQLTLGLIRLFFFECRKVCSLSNRRHICIFALCSKWASQWSLSRLETSCSPNWAGPGHLCLSLASSISGRRSMDAAMHLYVFVLQPHLSTEVKRLGVDEARVAAAAAVVAAANWMHPTRPEGLRFQGSPDLWLWLVLVTNQQAFGYATGICSTLARGCA